MYDHVNFDLCYIDAWGIRTPHYQSESLMSYH